jgi:alpha-beta hydrolase superfamily lysophospholipase
MDRVVEDVARARIHAAGVLGGAGPPVVWGHSMGGLAVLRYLQVHAPDLPAVVLSAPWLATALEVPSWKRAALPLLARLAPELTLSQPIDPTLLTRDPKIQAARDADPLVHHLASAGLIRAVESAQHRARVDPLPDGLPILVLLPGDDGVVDSQATREWARAAEGGKVEIRELPGVRHEPHQSPERQEIVKGVARWLEEKVGGGEALGEPGQNP